MSNSALLPERRILYSVPEVSARLNISKALVRSYIHTGLLPVTRLPHPSGIGFINRTLIHCDDLDAFAQRYRISITETKPNQELINANK